MRLSPKEIEKLMLHNAGFLAQKRLWRGVALNYPEAIALISTQILEFIRDGESVAELMDKGKRLLGFANVMDGVAQLIHEVQVEGTFSDGTKLVTVHQPICREEGDMELALYGSGLDVSKAKPRQVDSVPESEPGEYILSETPIVLNTDRDTLELEVTNTGDRPIQVGSHYSFFETNLALQFDREQSYGFRLDIPSGTAIRFEPGETRTVSLVHVGGDGVVHGGNGFIAGKLSDKNRTEALERFSREG
jgi:urease subunit gamma/beta